MGRQDNIAYLFWYSEKIFKIHLTFAEINGIIVV